MKRMHEPSGIMNQNNGSVKTSETTSQIQFGIVYINLESLSHQHVCIHHHMSRHLHQNVALLICQSHVPRRACDAIANGQVVIFGKLNAIGPWKATSWGKQLGESRVGTTWGISRTGFQGGCTQNLNPGGLTFWNTKHRRYKKHINRRVQERLGKKNPYVTWIRWNMGGT